ncbi:MAG TPA: hypothetical protein VK308_17370, partial [Pyrinomonadaceae bacterium]|nr:hypothetical protein [Pyrinomonadaceae bacterium]
MNLLAYARYELQRRAALLPREVGAWSDIADTNENNFGIHKSQFQALKIMMTGLLERQEVLLDGFSEDLSPKQFAEQSLEFGDEVVGTHDLWKIFRQIMAQRTDTALQRSVDAADLVAADCYLTCMAQARDWGAIEEQKFREPPLTFFEADSSPSTASRGFGIESLGFPIRRYRNMRLPIPIVVLPFDQAASLWMFCNLHHEVGHNLDADLGLRDQFFNPLLNRMNADGIPADRQKLWANKWSGEIVADVFGVMLGGAGFAQALGGWILTLTPAARFQELNSADVHPPFYIRVPLLVALLKNLEIAPLTETARFLEDEWRRLPKPDWVDDFVSDCEIIADVFLNQKLNNLGNHSLREFNTELANNMIQARQVADCLPDNSCQNPDNIFFSHR